MSADNKSLGRFILDGIAPAPRGIPQIEVTFNLDANGILNVSAKDKGTAKEQSITIQNGGNLNKDDVEKARKEAEAPCRRSEKKREAVDSKNQLENPIYRAQILKDDNGDKLRDDDEESYTDEAIEAAKKELEGSDKDKLEAAALRV